MGALFFDGAGAGRGGVIAGATFSRDRRYRYRLWRIWDRSLGIVAFVMLNPSTADATRDDPTIRRCVAFARRWGYGGVEVVNLFGLRATEPRDLCRARDAVGPANDRYLRRVGRRASLVVIAWGVNGAIRGRTVRRLIGLAGARCLGTTRSGEPRHPLYVRSDTRLVAARAQPPAVTRR